MKILNLFKLFKEFFRKEFFAQNLEIFVLKSAKNFLELQIFFKERKLKSDKIKFEKKNMNITSNNVKIENTNKFKKNTFVYTKKNILIDKNLIKNKYSGFPKQKYFNWEQGWHEADFTKEHVDKLFPIKKSYKQFQIK